MKIMGNYYNTQIEKKSMHKAEKTNKTDFRSQMQSMDSITISAPKEKVAELQFVNSLKSQISAEINAEKPAEQLDSLAAQIEKGTYEIGASEIAKRILLTDVEF